MKDGTLKILLIMADAHMHKLRLGNFVRSSREAPVTLTTLAALTGDSPIDYRVVDESVEPVPMDFDADLVGISVLTGTSRRAYALADHFRSRNIPVVLGGVHVTLMPDEARRFADTIVIGMADQAWPKLVQDFREGKLQKEYKDPPATTEFYEDIPTPRWDLIKKARYQVPYTIPFTRGCIHACDFCTVPGIWPRFQKRPVKDIVRDVKALPGRLFSVNDVSPFDDKEWAKELLTALIPLNKVWGALATTENLRDPELVDLLRRAGCHFLLLGFESVNQTSLKRIAKGFNKEDQYAEVMKIAHDNQIVVQGTFVFGFDEDGPDVFARTVERVQDLKVDIPRYSIYTPYPGSRLFDRLKAEGRILSYDWAEYDTMHVTIRPKNMSPAQLFEGFRWAYKETFKISSILERVARTGLWFPVTFFGNLTYRIFVKRLYQGRAFEMPINQLEPTGMVSAWKEKKAVAMAARAEAAKVVEAGPVA